MCGFIGVVGSGPSFPGRSQLRQMCNKLKHRGPDDGGEYFEQNVALGFRRLAILDLTANGHQPMSNHSGDIWVVYNGEIYNHLELRDEMIGLGYPFRGTSDTEVLIALYEHFGTGMFDRLNGMFAFAIYDKRKNIITLARDRLGVKPLFYWMNEGILAFASELKALKDLPGFPNRVDNTALGMYMRLMFVPGAACIYKGVKKLPPAHYIQFPLDNPFVPVIRKYWQVDWDVETERRSEKYWLDQIDELLYDAVRVRLRSDVPLGTFLSGGIDSGLITAMASRALGGQVRAFTVAFPGDPADESINAKMTADHLGISTVVEEMEGDALSLLPELAPHFDEPFADMSQIPTYQICKKMRKEATVILSGDGGDELFGGYVYHPIAWRMRHIDRIPDLIASPALKGLSRIAPEGSWLRRNGRRLSLPARMRAAFLHRDISEEWQKSVLDPTCNVSTEELISKLQEYHCLGQGRTSLDRSQAADLQLLLPDNMLVKVDRMSMKASVEVRSPFLDYRLAELIPRIPPELRVKNGQSKYLLRRLAERYLPREIVHGRKKGFDISGSQWLSGSKKEMFRKWLFEGPRHNRCLREENMKWLWNNIDKDPRYSSAVLRLAIMELWARVNLPDSR